MSRNCFWYSIHLIQAKEEKKYNLQDNPTKNKETIPFSIVEVKYYQS